MANQKMKPRDPHKPKPRFSVWGLKSRANSLTIASIPLILKSLNPKP